MLRASRQVLRPGGRTAFLVIELAPGLQGTARRRARAAAPPIAAARRPYRDLLASAGFRDVRADDVTPAYAETLAAWLAASARHEAELAAADGAALVGERLADWRAALDAVEEGMLRRTLYWARAPGALGAAGGSS